MRAEGAQELKGEELAGADETAIVLVVEVVVRKEGEEVGEGAVDGGMELASLMRLSPSRSGAARVVVWFPGVVGAGQSLPSPGRLSSSSIFLLHYSVSVVDAMHTGWTDFPVYRHENCHCKDQVN